MGAEHAALATSEDAVLGGRLLLRQPVSGHRVGHDAILLAAATGGRAGEKAVDLGAGVGGAGLALAARVDGLNVALVEIDPALCRLAAENAQRNRLADRVMIVGCDAANSEDLAAAGLSPGSTDRVLMNPPFHDASRANLSPDPLRRLAHAAAPGLLPRWVASAARLLKPQGILTMIWRADGRDEVLAALNSHFGGIGILPVQPRAGAPAIRLLLRAVKDGERREPVIYPPLPLNDEGGRPTAAAEAVLRTGETLGITEK